MGYSTSFKGELKFTTELTGKQLKKVNSFMGEDCRNHPEWGSHDLTHIDMEISKDFSGIGWNGSEKTYDLTEKVNLIIDEMRKEFPDFGLEGFMTAQGQDVEDRWILVIENGKAVKRKSIIAGQKVTCPHCGSDFILEK